MRWHRSKTAEVRFHNTTTQKPPKSGFIIRQPKNHRSAVVYVSTGLACLPRDAMSTRHYRRSAVVYVNTP